MTSISERIKAKALELGFESVGIAPLGASDHAAFYRDWIVAGRHGTMDYLARADAVDARLDPTTRWPELRSAIVATMRYADGAERDAPASAERAIIARYAHGRDYHKVLKQRQLALLHWLEAETGTRLDAARAYVDTGPVLERELAQRAGLGWYGRNTMLLHPRRGSYVFLGTLLVELELEYDAPFAREHCGTCSACVDSCPTGALLGRDENGAPVMDATRCISYLTIENRGPIPRALRSAIGNRVFGCDICQEVCPFNGKATPEHDPAFAARAPGEPPFGVQIDARASRSHPGTASPSLIGLMSMDNAEWEAFSRGSPLRRAGRAAFRRNVAVALGNWGDEAALSSLKSAQSDSDPLVRSHAAWAIGRIGSPSSVAALSDALSVETDPAVIEEIRVALTAASSASTAGGNVPAT